jgi:hypothetical protein
LRSVNDGDDLSDIRRVEVQRRRPHRPMNAKRPELAVGITAPGEGTEAAHHRVGQREAPRAIRVRVDDVGEQRGPERAEDERQVERVRCAVDVVEGGLSSAVPTPPPSCPHPDRADCTARGKPCRRNRARPRYGPARASVYRYTKSIHAAPTTRRRCSVRKFLLRQDAAHGEPSLAWRLHLCQRVACSRFRQPVGTRPARSASSWATFSIA